MIRIAEPAIGEEERKAVLEVLDSGFLAQGSRVKSFEESFAKTCEVEFAVATSSGTAALHTAFLAHGIGNGDEVITSPFTFIASANSILFTGARPVFVDIDPNTFNIDPELIEAAITSKTQAIMPVHLFGLSCNMQYIRSIARKHDLVIIEDACQSHGASYEGQRVGSFGTAAFSFYPTKNITSAEGGMITTNDFAIAEQCRVIRQHGMKQQYYHESLGFNFRMTDVHAAIGLTQLNKLPEFNQARQQNARYLAENLQGVKIPQVPIDQTHVFHQFTIRVPPDKRDALRTYLAEKKIDTGIYYPVPIHKQKLYTDLGYDSQLPEAESAAKEVLSLPVHPSLEKSELKSIVTHVNEFMARERFVS